MLPACFVLKLAKKMPMCLELIRRIQKVTELECTDISAPQSLLSLIVQHATDKQLDCQNNRGLAVVSIFIHFLNLNNYSSSVSSVFFCRMYKNGIFYTFFLYQNSPTCFCIPIHKLKR